MLMTEEPTKAPVHDRALPFPTGNTLSMTHGAYSAAIVGQEAAAVLGELAEFAPAWLQAVDQFELTAWATAEGSCRRLRRWIDEHGALDDSGQPRPVNDLLLKWERRAADARKRLGFDPLARAQLFRDRAAAGLFTVQGQHIAGADRLVQEGQQVAEKRLAALPAEEAPASDDTGA